jgi:hypothetical protein
MGLQKSRGLYGAWTFRSIFGFMPGIGSLAPGIGSLADFRRLRSWPRGVAAAPSRWAAQRNLMYHGVLVRALHDNRTDP